MAIIGPPKLVSPLSCEGSMPRRSADSWQVRVSVGRDPETGRYRYVGRYVQGTKRDAQRAAAELITEVDRGGHREEGRHTVNELLDRWMAHIEAQGRAESTLARYRSCINANIKRRLGARAINKLGPADIDRYYDQLAEPVLRRSASARATPSSPPPSTKPCAGVGSTPTRYSGLRRRPSGHGRSTLPPGKNSAASWRLAPTTTKTWAASSMSPPPPAPGEASCAGCAGATSTSTLPR